MDTANINLERANRTAVRAHPANIEFIDNPSEAVQLLAVTKAGNNLRFIKNPSDVVVRAALADYWHALEYVQNPSEELQMYVTSLSGFALQYIKNPSAAVMFNAVSRHCAAIAHIRFPSEQLQLMAVDQDGYVLRLIKNATLKVTTAAIHKTPDIVFDPDYAFHITPEILDAIAPELSAQVALIETLEEDDAVRATMFATYFTSLFEAGSRPVKQPELPDNLTAMPELL